MSLLFRYLSRQIATSVAMALLSLVLLFTFFDYIGELDEARETGYTAAYALLYVFLNIPGRIQELLPIAALIGALITLTRLSANSEFTVMRASGLSAYRMMSYLCALGLGFGLLTFLVGEYVSPPAERLARQIKIRGSNEVVAQEFRSGLWAKDGAKFINIRTLLPDGRLGDIRVFEFDARFQLSAVLHAQTGSWQDQSHWQLSNVTETRLADGKIQVTQRATQPWSSAVSPTLLSALIVNPERMAVGALNTYIGYLAKNKQQTKRYEMALWNKLAFPLAAPIMLLLALPFGYQPPRSQGMGSRVLLGILIGLGFHMLTRLFGNVGLLNDWPALISAFLPLAIFSGVAVTSLWYVERR
ncbi:MAG: LPS export ABC transporter permease LptG [Hydrogenophilales bacterium]|nr:LPS export ABC transporter permease LptG [Hydrogenophilales bacterium]